MTPFALSILGMEPNIERRRQRHGEHREETVVPEALQNIPEIRPARPSRRVTSHFNPFQTVCSSATDSPPAYAIATRQRPNARRSLSEGNEVLPKYICSVQQEGKFLLQLESINPLHGVIESEWREVYVVVRGTLLSIHRAKDNGPGKLLRSYTLQHAEVGLATDASHTILVPQTRLANLLPAAARRRAWQKDPDLFRAVPQHILRLRAETDQILLANPSEQVIHDMVEGISAGIDISTSIDERSIPKQCTVPRRRRRRPHFTSDITDANVIAEQERILRQMYPSLADEGPSTPRFETRPIFAAVEAESSPVERVQTSTREEDDLDLNVMREDESSGTSTSLSPHTPARHNTAVRPQVSRMTTSSSVLTSHSAEMVYATPQTNFDSISGKWQPPHIRSPEQIRRYIRRCKPVLLAEAVRASDIIICNGKRVKINWRMELLEEWELKPPSYRSHAFDTGAPLERTKSQGSASDSAGIITPQSSTIALASSDDQITPIESTLADLKLSSAPITTLEKSTSRVQQVAAKVEDARSTEVHGVVFCF